MIAHLRGRILAKDPARVIVEAAGVGYEVAISVPAYSSLPAEGSEVSVHVHTHVREDTIALYGFLRLEEKRVFERLISVSGIGPKLAMTVLSGIEADALVNALRANDLAALTKIPGVGKKTAERMVLELRDKLDTLVASQAPAAQASRAEDDVASALVNLGYQRSAAEQAAKTAIERSAADASFDALFRQAMSLLRK